MCIGSRNPDVERLVRRAYLLDNAVAVIILHLT